MRVDYFKREQSKGVFNYYKVFGGPGKTKHGYQEIISFVDSEPIILIEHNHPYDKYNPDDSFDLMGTWCQFEVGTPITESEYLQAYQLATKDKFEII